MVQQYMPVRSSFVPGLLICKKMLEFVLSSKIGFSANQDGVQKRS
jgi:hypothetical protein